jgi:hypothetical protein
MSSILIHEGKMLNFASCWNFLVIVEIRLLCHCIPVPYLLIAVLTSCNNCLFIKMKLLLTDIVTDTATL